jgi:streptogrisin C
MLDGIHSRGSYYRRWAAVYLALAATVAWCSSVQAATVALGDQDQDQVMIEKLAADDGVSLDEAKRRLELQSLVGSLNEELERILGADFAGGWYDRTEARGKLAALPDDVSVVRELVSRSAAPSEIDVVQVKHSISELEKVGGDLKDQMVASSSLPLIWYGVDVVRNRFRVGLSNLLPADDKQKARDLAVTAPDTVMVEFLPETERGTPLVCQYPDCDRPLRGGVGISPPAETLPFCTAGFVAVNPYDFNIKYLLTAGHCARVDPGQWVARAPSTGRRQLGPRYGWSFGPNGDWGTILVRSDSFWHTTSLIGRTAAWDVSEYLRVTQPTAPTPGALFCRYGITTRRSCGYVSTDPGFINYCQSAFSGSTGDVCHLFRGSACAAGGDSGGPATEYGNHPTGILSGGETVPPAAPCVAGTNPPPTFSFYTRADWVQTPAPPGGGGSGTWIVWEP